MPHEWIARWASISMPGRMAGPAVAVRLQHSYWGPAGWIWPRTSPPGKSPGPVWRDSPSFVRTLRIVALGPHRGHED